MRFRWAAALLTLTSCAYVLPAAWRAFHADPDDAAPAITRALDSQSLQISKADQAGHRIVTNWVQIPNGASKSRERYVISWERDAKDAVLTIYVRNESQDQESDNGRPVWGAVYHNGDKENSMLDLIAKELSRSTAPPPPEGGASSSSK
jgi:hypothetical protein